MRQNPRVGCYYLSGSVFLILLAYWLRPLGWILLWPALSTSLITLGYWGIGPIVYGKKNGRHGLLARGLHYFTRLGQDYSRRAYAKQCRPLDQLISNLYIGRQLTEDDVESCLPSDVVAVVDLTAEFTEPAALLALNYKNIALLDLTAPSNQHILNIVQFIDRQREQGSVYIHCKVGYSRTAAIAGCYLIHSGHAKNAQDAMELLRKVRPTIVIRPEAEQAIRSFASRCRQS